MKIKSILKDKKYEHLSNNSKLAYALLLDRSKVSDLIDDNGIRYVIYPRDEMGQILGLQKNAVIRIFKVLRDQGLIKEKRIGHCQCNRIYLA